MRPLEGLIVLEFAQFMAAPSAGLKLADLGARVIKIERPGKGEAGRQIAIKNLFVNGDSLVFHTINRNKESYAADLKNAEDLERVKKLIAKADIITHNFRPGVMEKIGLDYENAKKINPKIIYGVVTGYGNKGPWQNKPGQDLLVQSLSGLAWLSGTKEDGPVPFGLAVADMICGAHLCQGILAALIKRAKTQQSVLVEVSLMESILDLQFEVLTTHLNDGGKLPQRSSVRGNGHPYLSAPYGIYQAAEGYIALAMGDLLRLGEILELDLSAYAEKDLWFTKRDEIAALIAEKLKELPVNDWIFILEREKIWCSKVYNYEELLGHEAYKILDFTQELDLPDGAKLTGTRSPIHIDRQKLFSPKAAPKAGAQTDTINQEFKLI
ncbi:CoA transferase [Pseudoxanthomonas sp. SGD-10]|nr:CoA transferase [Pseudoxanthomonas sp. SGD-10]